MKVLVLGDYIDDIYEFYTATRLCPEGPVPVLVHTSPGGRLTAGGAGLVANQLNALFPESAIPLFGSVSNKTRVFADDRLMLRIDDDSFDVNEPEVYTRKIDKALAESKIDAIIVSDYNKGAFTQPVAWNVMDRAKKKGIPVFVDAKNDPNWYEGCFACFPNKLETPIFKAQHTIQKLGSDGCEVDGVHIPTNSHPVRDVTGAGDVFLAAFVYKWLSTSIVVGRHRLEVAAEFANKVAGISVEYVGTHVVTKEEIDNRVDSILDT